MFAYSARETLIDGVKRPDTRITRKKFVGTGRNQPISYGSQRRTGLLSAHVVKVDVANQRLRTAGNWVRLN